MPTEKNDTPSQEIVATENEGNEDLNNSDAEIQETPQNQTEEVKEKSRAKESTPREKTVTKPDNKAEEKTSLLDKFRLPHKDEENVQVQIVEEPKSLSQEETKKEEVVPTVVTQEVQPNKEVKEDTKEDPNVTVIQESDTSVTLKIKK